MEDFNQVYLVTHLMGADLNNIIRTQKLSDDHVQFLVYQILRGLKYIHSAGIIHRVSYLLLFITVLHSIICTSKVHVFQFKFIYLFDIDNKGIKMEIIISILLCLKISINLSYYCLYNYKILRILNHQILLSMKTVNLRYWILAWLGLLRQK